MPKVDGFSIPPRTAFRELSGLVLERYTKHYEEANCSFIIDLVCVISYFVDQRRVPKKLTDSAAYAFFSDTKEELERWMKTNATTSERIPKQHHGHMTHVFWELAETVTKRLTSHMRKALVVEIVQTSHR